MVVSVLEVEIYMPFSNSLKEKRRIINSIKDRISNKFNVSIAEIDYNDTWRRSKMAFAIVSNNVNYNNRKLLEILRLLEEGRDYEVLRHRVHYF